MGRLQVVTALPLNVVDDPPPIETAMHADGDKPGLARHEAGPLGHHRHRLGLFPRFRLDHRDLGYRLLPGLNVRLGGLAGLPKENQTGQTA